MYIPYLVLRGTEILGIELTQDIIGCVIGTPYSVPSVNRSTVD